MLGLVHSQWECLQDENTVAAEWFMHLRGKVLRVSELNGFLFGRF